MKLVPPIPIAYRRSLRFAIVVQLVALILSTCVDDDGQFIMLSMSAWAVFWAGALTLMRRRKTPTGLELLGLRYGPLIVPFLIFSLGQFL